MSVSIFTPHHMSLITHTPENKSATRRLIYTGVSSRRMLMLYEVRRGRSASRGHQR